MKTVINASAAVTCAGASVLCASNIRRIHRLRKAGIFSRGEAIAGYVMMVGGSALYAAFSAASIKDIFTESE